LLQEISLTLSPDRSSCSSDPCGWHGPSATCPVRWGKIRIRATTSSPISDRKEIIKLSKTFVTDQLINWSLNDTVTRVIVKIGVAYETDCRWRSADDVGRRGKPRCCVTRRRCCSS
jgi:hypothetical protein